MRIRNQRGVEQVLEGRERAENENRIQGAQVGCGPGETRTRRLRGLEVALLQPNRCC